MPLFKKPAIVKAPAGSSSLQLLLQKAAIFRRKHRLGEKIRPPLPSAEQRLLPPPAGDGRMITRQEHRRHRHPPENRRPGVLGVFKEGAAERFFCYALLVQKARQQPHHGIDHYRRRAAPR